MSGEGKKVVELLDETLAVAPSIWQLRFRVPTPDRMQALDTDTRFEIKLAIREILERRGYKIGRGG